MSTTIHDDVAAAAAGTLPRVIARMASGWAILGDPQILPGYCLLLPDPVVTDLNALTGEARQQFLSDMVRLGDAVLAETGAERINYDILGNLDPMKFGLLTAPILAGAGFAAAWALRFMLIVLWVAIVGAVAALAIGEVRYCRRLVTRMEGASQ